MRKKPLAALALVGLGLALLVRSGFAQADGEISFGIRPTEAFPDRPETFSYYFHELAPGVDLIDESLVMNGGGDPLTLKLYAADAVTAINGGTAFTHQGGESAGASRGTSRWLTPWETEVSLQPGKKKVIPFTIKVPPDASPGHHVAGLVVEALPSREALSTEEGETQFTATTVRRVGVAVVIDVPGPHIAGLEIGDAILRRQDDQGAIFIIAVNNTGNIFVKAEGSLLITDRNGKALAAIPLKLDTVLPGDATTFQIAHPVHLADGDYLLTVVLNYEGQTALLEGVKVTVKDGQPEGEAEEGLSPLPRALTELIPAPAALAAIPVRVYALAVELVLTLTAIALVVVIRRRRDKA